MPARLRAALTALGCLSFALPALLLAQGAAAQSLEAPRPSDRPLELPEFQPEQPPSQFELPPVPQTQPQAPSAGGLRFLLKGIATEGNTAFDDATLAELGAPYVGRTIGVDELIAIRDAITRYYVAAGYVTSGALIPDQRLGDGVVTFLVVEGRLSDVEVFGNKRIESEYLRARLERGVDVPLNIKRLQDNVLILLQDPSIERLNAELGPGQRRGDGRLQVEVEEGKHYDLEAIIDNNRSPSVGAEQGVLAANFRNLFGWGDRYSIIGSKSQGYADLYGSVSVPITADDLRIFSTLEISESEVVEPPFNAIDVESDSRSFEIGLSQPLWRTPDQNLTGSLSLAVRDSQTFLLGRGFAFSPGIDPDGRSRVTVARLAFDYTDRGPSHAFAARSTLSLGLPLLGATKNSGDLPDSQFLAWLGQAQYLQRLNDDGWQLLLRGVVQLANDPLLPLEKFSVGGFETVRGYRENLFVRDNGIVGSVEGRIPVTRVPVPLLSDSPSDGLVQFVPFVDFGQSWDHSSGSMDRLVSTGAGLKWQINQGLDAQIFYGEDLRDYPRSGGNDDLQDSGIHFRIRLRLN